MYCILMEQVDAISEAKKQFLTYELGLISIKAALSTRDEQYPVYNPLIPFHQRRPVHAAIRNVITNLETQYSKNNTENYHVNNIIKTADFLSNNFN